MAIIDISGSISTTGVAILGNASVIFATDANLTLSVAQYTNLFLEVTSSVSLTASRNIIAPLVQGQCFIVQNNTTGGQAIQIIASSGTGVTISNGSISLVTCDGTNYLSVGFVPNGDLAGSGASQTVIHITGASQLIPFAATIEGDSTYNSNAGYPYSLSLGNIVMGSDANLTLSNLQLISPILRITSGVSLTATRNIVLPTTTGAQYEVFNNTTGGQSLQFIGSTGTGITIPNGLKAIIYFDGTNWVPQTTVIGGDLSATNNISQKVIALQGNPVEAQSLGSSQDGYVLTWETSQWVAEPAPVSFTAGGDLAGTNTNQTVKHITGASQLIPFAATIEGDSTFNSNTGYPYALSVGNVVMGSDANLTLSNTQLVNPILRITSSVSLTATRNIVLPNITGAQYEVLNNTTGNQSLTFIGSSGTGVTVTNGLKAIVYFDGTNYVPATMVIGGDLSATTNTAQTVSKIQGVAISGTPAANYVLEASSSVAAAWVPATGVITTLSGDVTGPSNTNTVVNISGSAGVATVSPGTKLEFGTNPSTSGLINLPNDTFIKSRNSANTGDVNLIGADNFNNILIGDGVGDGYILLDANTNIQLAIDTVTNLTLTSGQLQWNSTTTNPLYTQAALTTDVLANNTIIQAQEALVIPLAGLFLVTNGSASVTSTVSGVVSNGQVIVFAQQSGIAYTVSTATGTAIVLTANYTGTTNVSPGTTATRATAANQLNGSIFLDLNTANVINKFGSYAWVKYNGFNMIALGASSSDSAIWMSSSTGSIVPASGNPVLYSNGNSVNLNAPTTSVFLSVGATNLVTVTTSSISVVPTNFTFSATNAAPATFSQTALASTSLNNGAVGQTWSITSQAGQAATGAGHNGGNGGILALSAGAGGTSGSANGGAGGNLVLSSGVGQAFGSEPASENAGILELQVGGTTEMQFDGYGMSLAKSTNIVVTGLSTLTLTAAEMLNPYLVFTGTVVNPSTTVTIPVGPASGFVRQYLIDISGLTLSTNSLIFTCGTGASTVTITAAGLTPASSDVLMILQPTANNLYLLGV